MVDLMIFKEAPIPDYTLGNDCKIDELIEWFRKKYPERNHDVGAEELYRATRDYVTNYC